MSIAEALPAAERRARARGPIQLVVHQTRYDLLSLLRDRQSRFFTLILPVMFLVIFVNVFGNHTIGAEQVKASTYYIPGISALGVIAASFTNLVIAVVAQRELGILKRRRATPVPAWVLVAGRTVTAAATSVVVVAVMLTIAVAGYGAHVTAATLPGILLTVVVGSAAFACLGFAVSTAISSADAAQPVVLVLTLPLYFISGVFVPSIRLPDWLNTIARVFPVQHLADALHHSLDPAATGLAVAWSDLGVIAAWGVAGAILAIRRFAWAPAGR